MHDLKKILLIENSFINMPDVYKALVEDNFQNTVLSFTDGAEALALLRKEGKYIDEEVPDLIILDLDLPNEQGHEILNLAKHDAQLKKIPLVVFSNTESEKDIKHIYNLHANCFLPKPTLAENFIKEVQTIEYFWCDVVQLPPKLIFD